MEHESLMEKWFPQVSDHNLTVRETCNIKYKLKLYSTTKNLFLYISQNLSSMCLFLTLNIVKKNGF